MTKEEAINLIADMDSDKYTAKEAVALTMAIKALEQTRWIPVSERLPEIHQDVLLSLRSLDVLNGFRAETKPYFYCQGNYIEPQNVLAWMPKPEHYKAESEDCISRAYIESIVEELENICINGDEHILSLLSDIKNAPSVTPYKAESEG